MSAYTAVQAALLAAANEMPIEVLAGADKASVWLRARALMIPPAPEQYEPCAMFRTPPMDFAYCETHDSTFPLGGVCWVQEQRETMARDVFVTDNHGLPRETAIAEWDDLRNTGATEHTDYAYAIADGLLALGYVAPKEAPDGYVVPVCPDCGGPHDMRPCMADGAICDCCEAILAAAPDPVDEDQEDAVVRLHCPAGGDHKPPKHAHYSLCPCGVVTPAEWMPQVTE